MLAGAHFTMPPFLATQGRELWKCHHWEEVLGGRLQLNLTVLFRLACLFLKRGADLGARDIEGRDPLTIAMETANADIVTL